MSNITKDGIEAKVGQVWRDLDKRCRGRTRTIVKVDAGFAWYGPSNNQRISIKRMHRHSTGFELVKEAQP